MLLFVDCRCAFFVGACCLLCDCVLWCGVRCCLLLIAVCCLFVVVCCLLFAVCRLLCVVCWWLCVAC